MADENHTHGWQDIQADALDRELDAALASTRPSSRGQDWKSAFWRILRADHGITAGRSPWRWPALAVVAAALVVAVVAFMARPEMGIPDRSAPEVTAQRPPTSLPADTQAGVRSATNHTGDPAHLTSSAATKKPARHGVRHAQEFLAGGPRLDHFPSPRPLSEEEKLLVRYVQDFPQEAVMIAKAQQESELEMEKLKGNESSGASRGQQQVQQQDQQ